jgi:hypothetical protein
MLTVNYIVNSLDGLVYSPFKLLLVETVVW